MRDGQAAGAARLAGQEFGLGGLVQTRAVRRHRAPKAFALIPALAFVVFLLFGILAFSAAVAAVLGVIFVAVCLVTVFFATRRLPGAWLARYEGGFAQMLPDAARPRVVRWDQVTEVDVAFRRVTTSDGQGGTSTSIVITGFGARPSLTPDGPVTERMTSRDIRVLVGDALAGAGPRLAARYAGDCDAGRPVSFGNVVIDARGVTILDGPEQRDRRDRWRWPAPGLVPWTEITSASRRSVGLPGGPGAAYQVTLRLARRPKRVTIPLSGVPNGIFLPGVLRHAAGRRGIRTRL